MLGLRCIYRIFHLNDLHGYSLGHDVRALLSKESAMRARWEAATISGAYEGSRVTLASGLVAPGTLDHLHATTERSIPPH